VIYLPTESPALSFQQKAIGKISFTTDIWTDPAMKPFMAVTSHWIETTLSVNSTKKVPEYTLSLRSALIAFHPIPGHHTGEHIAQTLLAVFDRYELAAVGSSNVRLIQLYF
jgi:hypothetical protein